MAARGTTVPDYRKVFVLMLWTILIILVIIDVVFFVLNRTRGGGRDI